MKKELEENELEEVNGGQSSQPVFRYRKGQMVFLDLNDGSKTVASIDKLGTKNMNGVSVPVYFLKTETKADGWYREDVFRESEKITGAVFVKS